MKAPKHVNVALVTVSSSRFMAKASYEKPSDESGDVAEREITSLGHRVVSRNLISDDRKMILNSVSRFLKGDGDVLIFLGGTGISKRDITIETVSPLLEKELPGFGELFRASSYREIGPAAMLTRATAGTVKGRVVICLPGSPDAALLAIRAFGTELPHAVGVART